MSEDKQEQLPEFDVVTDFYLPFKEVEEKHSSPILKGLRDNNIDPHEFLGEEKVEGVGLVEAMDEKQVENEKTNFGQSFLDFVKDIPQAAGTSTLEAGANITNNLIQLFGFGTNLAFKDTQKGNHISDYVTEFSQGYNKGTEEFVTKLDQYRQDNDVNGVANFVSDMGIDLAATIPMDKMLKKVGIPSYASLPLAFGLSYAFTGGDKKIEKNMMVDSEVINRLNETLGALPNTPEAEVAELVGNAFEGTVWGAAGDRLVKVFKLLKNNVPAYMNQQTAVSVGGAAASGEAVNKINQTTDQNLNVEEPTQNIDEEKKTLNQSSSLQDTDNMYASGGFGPVFFSMVREAAKKIPNKGSGQQLFNTIKNTKGVKETELKWTGLDDFLKDKKSVTKQEIQDYLQNNTLDVAEVKFGGKAAKFSDDLENTINNFESKYIARDPEAAAPNYDVYTFKTKTYASGGSVNDLGEPTQAQLRALSSKTGIDEQVNQVDFASIIRFPFKQLIKNTDDISKYLNANGKVEMTTVEKVGTSGVSMTPKNIQVLPTKEAEALVKSDSKNKLISTFEIDQLELEKAFVENKKREFRMMNAKAPKFEQYTEPGGEDYTELVFKIKQGGMDKGIPVTAIQERPAFDAAGNVIMEKSLPSKANIPFKNPSHMDVKSEIAHVRFKTREKGNMKILAVEEMQSDFAMAAKKKLKDYKKITDFPFKNNWYELTTKRLIRYAADNGFDAVAIPKGSVSAKRYGQDIYKATSVRVQPRIGPSSDNPRFRVDFLGDGDARSVTYFEKDLPKLEKQIGPKNYAQLKENIDNFLKNRPEDDLVNTYYNAEFEKPIIVGSGKGKVELYDKAIPSFMKKYGKKWNAKVYDDKIKSVDDLPVSDLDAETGYTGINNIPVTIIEITDDMRKSVQQDGQALFSILGLGVGSKIASDSMQNNIISETTN